jgi:SAM-dependent methyltransferase
MGDIFRRETAEHPEPFTGERLTGAIGGQVEIEHYHRYLLARSLVAGRDVLDVASGEGYGSALLAQVARSVIGVEYSGPTARGAAASFPRPNLSFVQADARALPLADGCVDAVVSFETIEHFDRQADFLHEVRRVLRPEGSFIVSTPDRDIYSPANAPANQFHVREMTRAEFAALLGQTFRHVQIVRQRALIGSALLSDVGTPDPPLVFDRRGDTHFEVCAGLPRAPYLIAVASDRDSSPLSPSLYIDNGDLDSSGQRIAAVADQLRQARVEIGRITQRAEQAEQMRAEAQHAFDDTERARAELERRRDELEHSCTELSRHIEALQEERARLQGSLRTFLRGYLPLLRRHLCGHRP